MIPMPLQYYAVKAFFLMKIKFYGKYCRIKNGLTRLLGAN